MVCIEMDSGRGGGGSNVKSGGGEGGMKIWMLMFSKTKDS